MGGEVVWSDLNGEAELRTSASGPLEPGQDFELRYEIREASDPPPGSDGGRPASCLTVVSQDLEDFHLTWPERVAPGQYLATLNLRRPVRYLLFLELAGDGSQRLHRGQLQVGRSVERAPALVDTPQVASRGPVEAELLGADRLHARQRSRLLFVLRESATGRAATGLIPHSGALGHVIALSEDAKVFGHAYADRRDGGDKQGTSRGAELTVEHAFPSPGLYKLWLQFSLQGGRHVADFVVRVRRSGGRPDPGGNLLA